MIKNLSMQDLRDRALALLDERVRIITAGLGLKELRAVLRGDPATERPNPRYRVHTTSFVFHIRPRYYQKASTWFTHTFRLGYFTTLFFIIEIITGLILMIYYVPSPAEAYGSILGHPHYNPDADMDNSGAVDLIDFTLFAEGYLEPCP